MRVALCIPDYDGRVHDEHATSLMATVRMADKLGIDLIPMYTRGCAVLPDVRNFLVAKALAAGCDKVWFVDSDISWMKSIPEALNMVLCPADIVAGLHQRKNSKWNGAASLVASWKTLPPKQDEETGCYEVNKVATAFVVIDKSVFQKLADAGIAKNYLPSHIQVEDIHYPYLRNYFWYDFIPATMTAEQQFHLAKLGMNGPFMSIDGEDFYFCRKATEVGCKIMFDPRIALTHWDGCVQFDVAYRDLEFQPVTVPVEEAA